MPTYAADDVRWFDALGECRCGCGKPGTGILRGSRNDSYGAYTSKCAEKRLTKARKEREAENLRGKSDV
jgi:hypothetical protein